MFAKLGKPSKRSVSSWVPCKERTRESPMFGSIDLCLGGASAVRKPAQRATSAAHRRIEAIEGPRLFGLTVAVVVYAGKSLDFPNTNPKKVPSLETPCFCWFVHLYLCICRGMQRKKMFADMPGGCEWPHEFVLNRVETLVRCF